MRSSVFAALVAFAVLGVASPAQQPGRDSNASPRVGTAVLSGVVVTNDEAAQPIRRARITLNGDVRSEGQAATSDDQGRFVFRGIPAGRYALQAFKLPYLPASLGARRPERPGVPVAVADGQTVTGLVIRMTRGAAVEGRVLDQNGEPVPAASVAVMRYMYSPLSGERSLTSVASVSSDDRGVYRAFGLAPGEFVIAARIPSDILVRNGVSADMRKLSAADVDALMRAPASGPPPMPGERLNWSPVYYPGTADLSAATHLMLAAGEEQTGLDVPLRLVPTGRISGVVSMPAGVAPAAVQISIIQSDPQARASADPGFPNLGFPTSARPEADGRYSLVGVTPGSYLVKARTGVAAGGRGGSSPGVPSLWASAVVEMQGQDVDVPLTLQPSVTVAGRVTIVQTGPRAPSGLRLILRPTDSGPDLSNSPSAAVADDTSMFAFANVIPGLFRFMWSKGSGPDVFLTSVTIRGREVLDGPIDVASAVDDMVVTFTDRPSEITGTLQDASGRPATDYFIVVFSTDKARWTPLSRRVAHTRPASDGTYSLKNLPAGEYFLAALTDLAAGDTSDPAFLESLTASAVRIPVTAGATTTQAFRIGGR